MEVFVPVVAGGVVVFAVVVAVAVAVAVFALTAGATSLTQLGL